MKRATAQQLLVAYAEVQDAVTRIRKRQEKIGDAEFNEYPDEFADFRYFGDKLEEALKGIEHRVEEAMYIVAYEKRRAK